ncbi:electron transfer flavoprotein subunit alpha/FixB family protein [Ferrimicrobium sp.]|uniref:electron transfer flavoprotein subunit alpha/FixB family protein n=1 Tax=Ferrimicrobium sp. TaxID=2926050 RepID=UPI00261610C4|nr:electron transfer flavoprotein subunit alpha/FixB family protein [Ferrimicrobium sp.]
MSVDVLVIAEAVAGEVPDVTYELLGKGRELSDGFSGELALALAGEPSGQDLFGVADVLFSMRGMEAAYCAPQWEVALGEVIRSANPKVVLVSTGTVGIDLAGALATQLGGVLASYVTNAVLEGGSLVVTSQLYGGKLMSEVEIDAFPAVLSVVPGSFGSDAGRVAGEPRREVVDVGGALVSAKGVAIELREPDSSGVDITAAPLLVSVGRGIGSKENVELVAELAEALKAPLSASRPVIDQGWLPKPHQVGKSGKKVKPTVYLAFGISGAPEHLEGMRSADVIIACNTDAKAPIFEVAHYGTTLDLFDLVPELTDQVGG